MGEVLREVGQCAAACYLCLSSQFNVLESLPFVLTVAVRSQDVLIVPSYSMPAFVKDESMPIEDRTLDRDGSDTLRTIHSTTAPTYSLTVDLRPGGWSVKMRGHTVVLRPSFL